MFEKLLSKKRILFVLGCCALIAARKMLYAVMPPGGPAVGTTEALSMMPTPAGTDTIKTGSPTPGQTPAKKTIDIPYGDIASVLEDSTVLDIVKLIPSVGNDIATSAEALGKLMNELEQFEADLVKANSVRQELQKMMTCSKAPQAIRAKSDTCKQVGCNGSRADCLKKAIADLRIVLHPFIEDLFVGYEKNGKKIDGIAYTILDVVHQPGTKKELEVVVKPLQTALKVLEVLENIIKIGAKPKETPAATPEKVA